METNYSCRRQSIGLATLLCLILALPFASADERGERLENVHVVYLNPELETYSAISRETLVYNGACIVSLPPVQVIQSLLTEVDNASYGPFDDSLVRIKVDGVSAGPVFLDARGGIFLQGKGVSKRLSEERFSKVKQLFLPLASAGDCRSLGRWPHPKQYSGER